MKNTKFKEQDEFLENTVLVFSAFSKTVLMNNSQKQEPYWPNISSSQFFLFFEKQIQITLRTCLVTILCSQKEEKQEKQEEHVGTPFF